MGGGSKADRGSQPLIKGTTSFHDTLLVSFQLILCLCVGATVSTNALEVGV